MSLVEQALKKIQQARATEPAAPHLQTGPVAASGRHASAPVSLPAAPSLPQAAHPPTRVVHVDREALRSKMLLPPVEQERLITHQLRHIKRPVVAKALGRGGEPIEGGQVVMVASALSGEGKTFTSINLSLSLAVEKDVSVLLVDADVAKPHLSHLFGMEQDSGLLDVLRDESLDVESVILRTDVPGLTLLPAGKQNNMATELLASVRMQQLVNQLIARDPRRIVIFDSPPVLLTSEARVLAGLAGQIVFVVRAGATPQQAVLDSVQLLPENKDVGFILNQSDEGTGGEYYDYYGQRVEEHTSGSGA